MVDFFSPKSKIQCKFSSSDLYLFLLLYFPNFCRKLNSVQTLPAPLLQWSAAPTQATIWSWRLLLVTMLIIRASIKINIRISLNIIIFYGLGTGWLQHIIFHMDLGFAQNLEHSNHAGGHFHLIASLCIFNCQISCTAAWRPTAGCLQWFTGAFNPPHTSETYINNKYFSTPF